MLDDKENQLKEQALSKIMLNAHHNLKDAFNKWKNQAEILSLQDALTNEKKKLMLDTLKSFVGNSTHSKLRIVLARFHEHAKIGTIQDRFFKKLLSTRSGAFIGSFNKWKQLPERKDNELYKLGNAFEKNLSKLIQNNLKSSFDPMKDINYDALATKKQCIRKLFEKAMSSNKRMFIHWHLITRNQRQVTLCKLVT